MVTWRLLGTIGAVSCLTATPCCASSAPKESSSRSLSWTSKSGEIFRLVRKYFFDPKAADAWAAKNASYAATAYSDHTFANLTRHVLAELKTSHTDYYTAQDPEYYSLLAIYGAGLPSGRADYESIGADFTKEGFLRVVFAEGPAARAGLRRGDRILSANGKAFDLIASFRNPTGRPVVLTVQRKPSQPPIAISIRPRRVNPKQEWLQAQAKGAKLIKQNGQITAYVPMFACAGDEYHRLLQDLLSTQLRNASSLILDFRDGWGGCNPDFVNLFSTTPSALTYIGREGNPQQFDLQWRKPLFLLINGGTRSGKEVVAYSVKKHRLGTLVGQPTAGAVAAGRCFLLSDRSLLLLAVADVRVGGERLEGRG